METMEIVKQLFHAAATFVCFFHAMWWSKNGLLNFSVKFVFYIMTIWGALICLNDWGFIIKK